MCSQADDPSQHVGDDTLRAALDDPTKPMPTNELRAATTPTVGRNGSIAYWSAASLWSRMAWRTNTMRVQCTHKHRTHSTAYRCALRIEARGGFDGNASLPSLTREQAAALAGVTLA